MMIDTAQHTPATELLATTFKALSEETRLQIVILLLEREELCVCDVVGALALTQSKASRHLRYLYNAGLVDDRREGTWMHYSIAQNMPTEQRTMLDALAAAVPDQQKQALVRRLDEWLEDKEARQAQACAADQCRGPGQQPA